MLSANSVLSVAKKDGENENGKQKTREKQVFRRLGPYSNGGFDHAVGRRRRGVRYDGPCGQNSDVGHIGKQGA